MSNFHFLKKDLEWKIVKTQGSGPTTHMTHNPQTLHSLLSYHSRKNIYPWILTGCAKRTYTHRLFVPPCPSLLYIRSREKIYPFLGTPEMSDKLRYEWRLYLHTFIAHFAFCPPYFLSSVIVQERKTYTPLYPLPGNSRNEWQIEIWVTNHFKILCAYYTWSLSWTTYYLNIHNNLFGEKNSSTFSIALDVPSSISTKALCTFAHIIIPISFLTLI